MPSKRSQPRPLEFRLSLEASERINQRIQLCQLPILQNVSLKESKLKRLGQVANEAIRILEADGHPIEGCSDEAAVSAWLNRERGKELTVFKALCQAVDENWIQAFDRQLYGHILQEEQTKTLEIAISSFFSMFVSSSEQNESVLAKYQPLVEQVVGSSQSSETIRVVFETFLQEFVFSGRQIRFQAISAAKPLPIVEIEIVGRNQHDQLSTWSDRFSQPYPLEFELKDWWWQGEVHIQFQAIKNEQAIKGGCQIFIPPRGYMWANISYELNSGECNVG